MAFQTFLQILAVLGFILACSDALQCYNCIIAYGVPSFLDPALGYVNFPVTPKCEFATNLTDDLLITCPDEIEGGAASCGIVLGVYKTDWVNLTYTQRGCLQNLNQTNYCTDDRLDCVWYDGDEPRSAKFIAEEEEDIHWDICKCTDEKCNGVDSRRQA